MAACAPMKTPVDLPSVLAHLPPGAKAPDTLEPFSVWLATQERGAVGWIDAFAGEPVPRELLPEDADPARVHRKLTVFLALPDGSRVALWYHGPEEAAVVLLGSEGELETVAVTFRAFLDRLARGETGIGDLDDEEASEGRGALLTWLERFSWSVLDEARRPAFAHWLATGEVELEGVPRALSPEQIAELPARVTRALGHEATHPDARALLEATWDGPLPGATLGTTYLANKAAGFCVYLTEDMKIEGAFFYAAGVEGYARFAGPLPGGVTFEDDRATLEARLGPPAFERKSKKTGALAALRWDLEDGTRVWASFEDGVRVTEISLALSKPRAS